MQLKREKKMGKLPLGVEGNTVIGPCDNPVGEKKSKQFFYFYFGKSTDFLSKW